MYKFTNVNMEGISKRIEEIIKNKKISASEFSQKIDVQRSTLSHIINGRNKASLEIVTKICIAYPDVSLDWLIFGNKPHKKPQTLKSQPEPKKNPSDVQKIILLLKNGTFQTFEN